MQIDKNDLTTKVLVIAGAIGIAVSAPYLTAFVIPSLASILTDIGKTALDTVKGISSNVAWDLRSSFKSTTENEHRTRLLGNAYYSAIEEVLRFADSDEKLKHFDILVENILPSINIEIKALLDSGKQVDLYKLFPNEENRLIITVEDEKKVPFHKKLLGIETKNFKSVSPKLFTKTEAEEYILNISNNSESAKKMLAEEVEISLRRWFAQLNPQLAKNYTFPPSLDKLLFEKVGELIPSKINELVNRDDLQMSWVAFQRSHLQAILRQVNSVENKLSQTERNLLRPLGVILNQFSENEAILNRLANQHLKIFDQILVSEKNVTGVVLTGFEQNRQWQESQFQELQNSLEKVLSFNENLQKCLTVVPLIENTSEIIGREDDLQKLREYLNISSKVILVNGLGGIGKTTLAKYYLTQYFNDFNHIIWVNVDKGLKEAFVFEHDLVQSLKLDIDKTIKDNDSIDYSFSAIISKIREIKGNNLLVIDNLGQDAENSYISDAISLTPDWKVIATSRCNIDGFMNYELDFLSPEEAKELFLLHYRGKYVDKDLDYLLELIGHHTLTIELLAKTLEKNFTLKGIKALIKYLETQNLNSEDLEVLVKISHSKEEVKIYTHLMKAFNLLEIGERQKKTLLNFSILPSFDIKGTDLISYFSIGTKEQTDFVNSLNDLVKKGWLKSTQSQSYKCHQIIREIVKYKLNPDSENCREIIDFFAQTFFVRVGENPLKKKRFLPFGESILQSINDETPQIANLADNLAKTLRYFGYNDKAIGYALQGKKIREKLLRPDDNRIGDSFVNISVIYRYLSNFQESLNYAFKSLDFFKNQVPKDYVKIATSHYKITLCFIRLKQYETAKKHSILDMKALNKAQKNGQLKKKEFVYYAETLNTRGEIFRELEQFEKALNYKLKALVIRKKELDKNHPDLAISYHQIALTYFEIKNFNLAEEYIRKAVQIRRKLPQEHLDLRESLDLQAKIQVSRNEITK